MTAAENVERTGGTGEEPGALAARCAAWLLAERDRIEREVRATYERTTAGTHSPAGTHSSTGTLTTDAASQKPPGRTRSPRKPREEAPPDAAVPATAPAAAAPLILLLDRLAELPPPAPAAGTAPGVSGGDGGGSADPVLGWVRRSVLAALAASGVDPVEDRGPVDPTRHNVVATRADPSGLRGGTIAETVRPGYLWGEAVLRHQEVVVYVAPGKPGRAGTAAGSAPDGSGDPHETRDAPHSGEEGGPCHGTSREDPR